MQTQESTLAMPGNANTSSDAQSWHDLVQPWWSATRSILPTYLLTRFILLLLSYFGGVLFTAPNFSSAPISYHDLVYSWDHWDTIRYLAIAAGGYTKSEDSFFFPLYPALLRTFALFLKKDILTVGILFSNSMFLGVLMAFYRLVEMEFDRDTAKRSALYLAIFPTALFFFAAYSESLFLFFVLLSFYAMRRSFWWLAGLFGALATLTNIVGIFLFVIFLCEFGRQVLPSLRQAWRDKQTKQSLHLATGALAALLIPFSLGVYAYSLKVTFGDPLAFVHAQTHWTRGISLPWVGPLLAMKGIVQQPHSLFAVPHDIFDLTALLLFLTLMVLCFFGPEHLTRNQWPFALFGLLLLFYALLFPGIPPAGGLPYDPLPSMERIVLSIFPGFILLARLGRRPWFHQGYLMLSLPMLAFFVLQFITGHWTV